MKKIIQTVILLCFVTMFSQKSPYPIIFIHGLNSDSAVWIDQGGFYASQGMNFGGRIDYCLNYDGNNLISNKNTYPTLNADIALFTEYNSLNVGDYYFLNFNIDNQGRLPSDINFSDVLSNEAAIVKQGVALKYVIQMVLLKTGRDKVILMGHSMGGLCAREYLQNPSNWQPDGQHHVAKLITTGTPHGGYTGTNASIATGIDSSSDAYRDLRTEYSNSNPGVFLNGGIENSATLGNNFYNNDVNCNAVNNDNTTIIGINQKSLSANLDFAYIVGNCTNCFLLQGNIPGDGIVRAVNANFGNFYAFAEPKNEFIYIAEADNPLIGLHTDLPHAIIQNMKGLDEPNEFNLSYIISPNIIYRGFITEQPINGYSSDFDDYKFTINESSLTNINIENTYSNNLYCRIMNSSFIQIATTTINPNSNGTFTQSLVPGQYYLEFFSTPSATSYNFPYTFNFTTTLGLENVSDVKTIIFPNPSVSKIFIQSKSVFDKIEIYNLLGQKVISTKDYMLGIDISNLESGNYIIKLYSDGIITSEKLIKE